MFVLDEIERGNMAQVCLLFATAMQGQTVQAKMEEGKFLLGDGRE